MYIWAQTKRKKFKLLEKKSLSIIIIIMNIMRKGSVCVCVYNVSKSNKSHGLDDEFPNQWTIERCLHKNDEKKKIPSQIYRKPSHKMFANRASLLRQDHSNFAHCSHLASFFLSHIRYHDWDLHWETMKKILP